MKTTPLFELKKIQTEFPSVKIASSEDSEKFIRQFYGDDLEIFESFFILLLNRANKTVGYAKISQGGITGTVVDVKLIAKYCVESLASSVILAHNHPSGNLSPSDADKRITERTAKALELLEIQVLDHIILTQDGSFSFADSGLI
jgi:DNA repair protein RadC